jgi:citrate synthase
MRTLQARLERGEQLPGFGHRLYPDGDPRASVLLDLLDDLAPDSVTVQLASAFIRAADELQGVPPNIDFALVTIGREFGLPSGSAMSLMALGRTAGWIAHAMEEHERNQLIQPRVRSAT